MLSIATIRQTQIRRRQPGFVLLVDDHEPSLKSLTSVVELAGHRCMATLNPSEAQTYCLTRRPSLVVTDLSMPCLDGHGLACWLKARYPGVPLMLLTGEALDPPTLALYSQTFAAVMAKPLQVEPFLGWLDRLLPPPPARPCP